MTHALSFAPLLATTDFIREMSSNTLNPHGLTVADFNAYKIPLKNLSRILPISHSYRIAAESFFKKNLRPNGWGNFLSSELGQTR